MKHTAAQSRTYTRPAFDYDDEGYERSLHEARTLEPKSPEQYPMGVSKIGDMVVVRTPTSFSRNSMKESGPRTLASKSIDYRQAGQSFACLYSTLAQIIAECGACSRTDLHLIPALSRYSGFQLERALLTATHHGLLRRIGNIPSNHPDAPPADDVDAEYPGIYDIEPLGPIDRSNPEATVRRALASRPPIELVWAR